MNSVRVYIPVPDAAGWSATVFEPVARNATSSAIAMLDNSKPRADYLLAALSRRLQCAGEPTNTWHKYTASIPVADDMLRAVVGEADLCITGLAD